MKQKTILTVIVVSIVSIIVAYFSSNLLFRSPKNREQKVEKVEQISTDFKNPDKTYFNEKSIDPTQIIKIGGQ